MVIWFDRDYILFLTLLVWTFGWVGDWIGLDWFDSLVGFGCALLETLLYCRFC